MEEVELAIVGAGPAGLAAAVLARECGLSVALLDEQGEPGGQIYRSVETVARERPGAFAVLGDDYAAGLELAQAFRASGARYLPQTSVWRVDADRNVWHASAGRAGVLQAGQVLMATGAMERAMPFPGWTLPGVMTCGAAQVLLKSAAIVPQGRVFIAGSGPLLLLLASQLLRAGVRIAGVLETVSLARRWPALRHLPAFIAAPGYLGKGLSMLGALRRAKVPLLRNVTDLRAQGGASLSGIEFRVDGVAHREACDVLLIHQGVVPNANLALSTRCRQAWDDVQRCFRPVLDGWGNSSIDGLLIAGDSAGIGGAKVAEQAGRLTALAAACALGRIDATQRDARAAPVRAELARHRRARAFLDAVYRPAQATVAPRDPETIVCRCEEVTAGEVRRIVAGGCPGPNQMKAFARCGMGPCQGRLCGLTVTELIAEERGVSQEEVGYYRIRSPIKPLTMGELAALGVQAGKQA